MTSTSVRVLAVDLGTSRVKVAVVSDALEILASAKATYPSIRDVAHQCEQRPSDWLDALGRACGEVTAAAGADSVDAVVLTAQMPTLVAVDHAGDVIGNAVTWQDSRADELVRTRLSADDVRLVREISGAPIDGRYVVPMHLRRSKEEGVAARLLSAKDYLFYVATGEWATDPSTASGFGVYDFASRGWSEELCQLWGVPSRLLPDVADATFFRPLSATGASYFGSVAVGTPVFVGGADSVCAHHLVSRSWPRAVSVIDGSSTVIITSSSDDVILPDTVLRTPLVDSTASGAELDLLATGSSVGWLAQLLELSPERLETLAATHPSPAKNGVLIYPYLGGGEQGTLWRDDLSGVITGVDLATSRADLARALLEGIAFETYRCVSVLRSLAPSTPVVTLSATTSSRLVPGLLAVLLGEAVIALADLSPSLLGAALVALDGLGVARDQPRLDFARDSRPRAISADDARALLRKSQRYFADSPAGSGESFVV